MCASTIHCYKAPGGILLTAQHCYQSEARVVWGVACRSQLGSGLGLKQHSVTAGRWKQSAMVHRSAWQQHRPGSRRSLRCVLH